MSKFISEGKIYNGSYVVVKTSKETIKTMQKCRDKIKTNDDLNLFVNCITCKMEKTNVLINGFDEDKFDEKVSC